MSQACERSQGFGIVVAVKLVVVGTGLWGRRLIPLFKLHPQVSRIALCDLDPGKLAEASQEFDIPEVYSSLDAVCRDETVDAVALVTQHWLHAPQAVQALEAGKHVYSSAPAGVEVEEVESLVRAVDRTSRIYVMGETSYYYSWVYYCKQRFRAGDFGRIVYSEADYFHDLEHGLRDVFKERGGERWQEVAVIPPMLYLTHCTSQVIGITGAHMTQVACNGFLDTEDDGVFLPELNRWSNRFSNQTALFQMSDGSSCRANVYWRVGHPSMTKLSLYGTKASFEYDCTAAAWSDRSGVEDITRELMPGVLKPSYVPTSIVELARRMKRAGLLPSWLKSRRGVPSGQGGPVLDVAPYQPVDTLPGEYAGLQNMGGEWGTNYFMVNEFIAACATGELPPNNVWQAARYTIPGIIAHESAIQGGRLLPIPDFGDAPA
jgi:predicted dehydrogenase